MRIVARLLFFLLAVLVSIPTNAQNADSLALAHGGLPVVFKKDTLFYVYSKIGPYKPADRVSTIQRRLNALMDDSDLILLKKSPY